MAGKQNSEDAFAPNTPDQPVDESLFGSAEEQTSAEQAWNDGGSLAAQANPVGTFVAVIDEATLGRSQSSNRLQITYKLRIIGGPSNDAKIGKYDGLETPAQAKITRQQLERLGINTKALTLAQLPAVLLDLTGKTVQINAKQNGQFYNIFFQKLLQPGENPTAGRMSTSSGAGKPF